MIISAKTKTRLSIALILFFAFSMMGPFLYVDKSVVGAETFTVEPMLSAGFSFSLALKEDGSVWAWGINDSGQLGDGTTEDKLEPVQVTGLTQIIAISSGPNFSLALKNDGTVWAWGDNSLGQLGDGTTVSKIEPVQLTGLSGITSISAGGYFSMALKDDGTVWVWGTNWYGQLGDGTTTDRISPVRLTGVSGVSAISAGSMHSLALKDDGTVLGWGLNGYGQVGDGTTDNKLSPVIITDFNGITDIFAGDYHSVALMGDGTVWSWGLNDAGQLGDGKSDNKLSPALITDFSEVSSISAGYDFNLALKDDGTVWVWGGNNFGQLGDGTNDNKLSPVQVTGLSGVIAKSVGWDHSLVLKEDGTVWAWGRNISGQLGDGRRANKHEPVQLTGLSGIADLRLSDAHTLALKSDGTLLGWGMNNYSQLGDGTKADRQEPVQATELSGVTAISVGNNFSLALKSDGTVWGWGRNGSGQLGDGTLEDKQEPVQATGLSGVVAIYAGEDHSLALKSDGTVWVWGRNGSGQLGDGTTNRSSVPVQITTISDVVEISSGVAYSLALKSDGTVFAWGRNNYGQLGDGTTENKLLPVQITDFSGVTNISAGGTHSLALKNDGTLWAWGRNTYGQLGDGTMYDQLVPIQVTELSGIEAINAGANQSMVLKEDGNIWAWGYNNRGQLGDGSTVDRFSPVLIEGLSGVSYINTWRSHTLAIKDDGTVWAWGLNDRGQLGDGSTWSNIPLKSSITLMDIPQVVGDLKIGDRLVDNSWQWEYRTGDGYTHADGDPASSTTNNVTWIVVAKNHYDGLDPHVTLLAEDLIGRHSFDNSTNTHIYGYNHWGESGTHETATLGLRPWLNSTGIHEGEGFYHAFSDKFKSGILTTTLPNKEWESGIPYTTEDKVFIPSTTELGDAANYNTYEIGTFYPYFIGAGNNERIALEANDNPWGYWSRSPNNSYAHFSLFVRPDGSFASGDPRYAGYGVRPAINLVSDIPISGIPNIDGAYEIIHSYTVTFKDHDGTVLDTDNVFHGGTATAPADPECEGYTFHGWDKGFNNVTSDITVTAEYEINHYSITFDTGGGTAVDDITKDFGTAVTAPDEPIKTGYTFAGWDPELPATMPAENITVTAQWDINTYTVTFKDWDGTELKTETVEHGSASTAPTAPAREAYTFIGWDTDFSNITAYTTVTAIYEPKEELPVKGPVTGFYILTGDFNYYVDIYSYIENIEAKNLVEDATTAQVMLVHQDGLATTLQENNFVPITKEEFSDFLNKDYYHVAGGYSFNLSLQGTSDSPVSEIFGIEQVYILCGDASGDGELTVRDAIIVLRHLVGLAELDEISLRRAAVSDAPLSVKDAVIILRRVVGLAKNVHRLI